MARRKGEKYYSPDWAIRSLRLGLPFILSGSVYEPCVGTGMLSKPLKKMGLQVITNDMDEEVAADHHYDFLIHFMGLHNYQVGQTDWVITNPPFSLALPILENALAIAKVGVAFLLRLSFAEPVDKESKRTPYPRAPFFDGASHHIPRGVIVNPRYSFTEDGKTDSVTTAWFVWLVNDITVRGDIVWDMERQFIDIISRKRLKEDAKREKHG